MLLLNAFLYLSERKSYQLCWRLSPPPLVEREQHNMWKVALILSVNVAIRISPILSFSQKTCFPYEAAFIYNFALKMPTLRQWCMHRYHGFYSTLSHSRRQDSWVHELHYLNKRDGLLIIVLREKSFVCLQMCFYCFIEQSCLFKLCYPLASCNFCWWFFCYFYSRIYHWLWINYSQLSIYSCLWKLCLLTVVSYEKHQFILSSGPVVGIPAAVNVPLLVLMPQFVTNLI